MMRLLTVAISVFFAASVFSASMASAYSRGPYLPQDADLRVPGVLQVRDGLNERCEDRRFPCDGRSELVLVKTAAGFDFGNVRYDCEEIDDGAYGALKCTQVGFTRIESYRTCSPQLLPPTPAADLDFRSWYCWK